MKILQMVSSFQLPGETSKNRADALYGAERSTLALCRGLRGRGHEVIFVCETGSPLTRAARNENFLTLEMHFGTSWSLSTLLQVLWILHRIRPDILATQLRRATRTGALGGQIIGVPVVATARTLKSAKGYGRATRLIAISEAVRQNLAAQNLPLDKIDVVYNGLDLDAFVPQAPDLVATCKSQIGMPDVPIVGIVGRLASEKGHLWLLQAASQLRERQINVAFLFVGDGQERAAIEAEVARLELTESVHFAGYQADVVPYLAAMDVVVQPSIANEGFGRVLVEAGAMEKPLVVSDIGGMSEIVSDGQNGFVVRAQDVTALASALEKLLLDGALRGRLGREGRRLMLERFTLAPMVSGTEECYTRVLKRR